MPWYIYIWYIYMIIYDNMIYFMMANDISRERNNIFHSNEMISRERNSSYPNPMDPRWRMIFRGNEITYCVRTKWFRGNEITYFVRTKWFRSNEMISRERNNIRFFHRCPLRGSVQYTVTFKKKKGKSYLTIEKWKRTCMHYKCVTKCNKDL